MSATLLDKVWDGHVVDELGGGYQLLHVDRHLLHDLGGPIALGALEQRGLAVRNPELCFATEDHCVSSAPGRKPDSTPAGARLIPSLRQKCRAAGIALFDMDAREQGIVHVIGPELGLTLPGATLVCGDSHTCTHGALGALAWGIGTSEVTHVLASQCIIERKPSQLRVRFEGALEPGTHAKDLILALIARHGADIGVGYAVEYAGTTTSALSVEERMTICNLSIELGAKIGQIAPDATTYTYLEGRPFAPKGTDWDAAVGHWQTLQTDDDAVFDREISLDAGAVRPQISWGTSPAHTIGIDEAVPDPADARSAAERGGWKRALEYMDLVPGQPIQGTPIDRVFIGSCTNSRLSDLEAAAAVFLGRRVAPGIVAWAVPGSQAVKREAEARGLDQVFLAAGVGWREPGCSQCVATNAEYVAPGQRCVSTSNRNFVGRQGPGARTHLASPATAAASAVAGRITSAAELE